MAKTRRPWATATSSTVLAALAGALLGAAVTVLVTVVLGHAPWTGGSLAAAAVATPAASLQPRDRQLHVLPGSATAHPPPSPKNPLVPRPSETSTTSSLLPPSRPHDALLPTEYRVVQVDTGGPLPDSVVTLLDPVADELPLTATLLAPGERIVVATASCAPGDGEDLAVWLKAILLFGAATTQEALETYEFHVFADDATLQALADAIAPWDVFGLLVLFTHPPLEPAQPSPDLVVQCARLPLRALPAQLAPLDRAIFIDRSALVLGDLRPLWAQARRFSERQVVAMAQETRLPYRSRYRIPDADSHLRAWGLGGLSATVILVDLDKARRANWTDALDDAYEVLVRAGVAVTEQDVLNLWLFREPDRAVPLDCRWSVRGQCRSYKVSILSMDEYVRRSRMRTFPRALFESVVKWPSLAFSADFVHVVMTKLAPSTADGADRLLYWEVIR